MTRISGNWTTRAALLLWQVGVCASQARQGNGARTPDGDHCGAHLLGEILAMAVHSSRVTEGQLPLVSWRLFPSRGHGSRRALPPTVGPDQARAGVSTRRPAPALLGRVSGLFFLAAHGGPVPARGS